MSQQLQHIFLLGILERSGTNFLYNSLVQHPEISEMAPAGEDFLLKEAGLLQAYCQQTASNWHPMWGGGFDQNLQLKTLKSAIGDGLLAYLAGEQPVGLVCSKTPSSLGVEHISEFFPSSKVILLVREPVQMIASGIKSFGWTWRGGTRDWLDSAQRILNFHERRDTHSIIVRYEDLIHHPDISLEEIFAFLGVSKSVVTAKSLSTQPVVGSSNYGTQQDGIQWEGVKAGKDFAPTKIPDHVPDWAIRKVFKSTKKIRNQLGYPPQPDLPPGTVSGHVRARITGIKEFFIDNRRAFRKKSQPKTPQILV